MAVERDTGSALFFCFWRSGRDSVDPQILEESRVEQIVSDSYNNKKAL